MFQYEEKFKLNDKITFSKAVYYNFNPVPVKNPGGTLPEGSAALLPFRDGSGFTTRRAAAEKPSVLQALSAIFFL